MPHNRTKHGKRHGIHRCNPLIDCHYNGRQRSPQDLHWPTKSREEEQAESRGSSGHNWHRCLHDHVSPFALCPRHYFAPAQSTWIHHQCPSIMRIKRLQLRFPCWPAGWGGWCLFQWIRSLKSWLRLVYYVILYTLVRCFEPSLYSLLRFFEW